MARTVKVPGKGNAPRGERAPRASRARTAGGTSTGAAGGTSGPPPTEPRKHTPEERKLREALVQAYTLLGGFVQVRGQMGGDIGLSTAGVNIHSRAGEAADVWIDLCRQNPQVKRVLMAAIQGGAVAAVVGMNAVMIVPVLSARGLIKPEFGALALNDEAKQHWMEAVQAQQAAAASPNGNGASA
jgi:hypothetical protein